MPAIENAFTARKLELSQQPKKLIDAALGSGEKQALSIALEKSLSLICDDRKARVIGSALGVRILPISAFILWGVKTKRLTRNNGIALLDSLVHQGYRLKLDAYLQITKHIKKS